MLLLPTTYPSLPSPIFLFLRLAGSIRSHPFLKHLNTPGRRSSSQITPGVFLLIYSILYSLHVSTSALSPAFLGSSHELPDHPSIVIRDLYHPSRQRQSKIENWKFKYENRLDSTLINHPTRKYYTSEMRLSLCRLSRYHIFIVHSILRHFS